MCPNCFQAGIYGFPSWWEYEAFEQQLMHKPLRLLPVAASPESTACYECAVCREVWVLSEPENAWRGYFLPPAVAEAYHHKLGVRDKVGRLGCLVVLLAVALFIGWQLL